MRLEKESIVKEIRDQLEGSSYVLLTEYRGLKVSALNDLRGRLAKEQTRFKVVKNTFLTVAASQCGRDSMAAMLEGPLGMITGGEVTRVARIVRAFAKEQAVFKVRGGMLGQTVLSPASVEALASVPSREVLYGQLAGTLVAPMRQVVGVMQQKLLSLVYVLQAAGRKKG